MDNFSEATTNVMPDPNLSVPVDTGLNPIEANLEPDIPETVQNNFNMFEPEDTANEPIFEEFDYDSELNVQSESTGSEEQAEGLAMEDMEISDEEAEQEALHASLDDVYEKLEEVRVHIEEQVELNRKNQEQQNLTEEQLAAAMLLLAMLLKEDEKRRGADDKSMFEVIIMAFGNLMKEMFVPEDGNEHDRQKEERPMNFSLNTNFIGNIQEVFSKRQSQKQNLA